MDDSYNKMPVNPGNDTNKGTAMIDGGTYNIWLRSTTGTGGNRCGSSVTNWQQFYSVRQTARSCGQISISDHFAAWNCAGLTLGAVLEASILIEAGGGTGKIDFTTANVTAQFTGALELRSGEASRGRKVCVYAHSHLHGEDASSPEWSRPLIAPTCR